MKYIIIIILALFSGWMISDMFLGDPSVDQAETKWLKRQREDYILKFQQLNRDKFYLIQTIDSLMQVPAKIEKQVIYLQAEVDSIIAKDSLNSIKEYRSGLKLLGIRPEIAPTLTLREIGLGALTFRETYGLRLRIIASNEIISNQDILIGKQENLIDIKDNVIKTDSSIILSLELLVEEVKPTWLQSRTMILIYIILAFAGGLAVAL